MGIFLQSPQSATTPLILTLLQGHMRKKHPTYYLCAFCDKKTFRQHKLLRVHLINEHDVKCGAKDFYVCWKCKKCCLSFKELDEHLSSEHGMKKNEHRCQLCVDESFSSKVTLKMHVLKFHEIDFSKVSNTPFIQDLFDIITEPNVKTINGFFYCLIKKAILRKSSKIYNRYWSNFEKL